VGPARRGGLRLRLPGVRTAPEARPSSQLTKQQTPGHPHRVPGSLASTCGFCVGGPDLAPPMEDESSGESSPDWTRTNNPAISREPLTVLVRHTPS
jgi:hypothetical protein